MNPSLDVELPDREVAVQVAKWLIGASNPTLPAELKSVLKSDEELAEEFAHLALAYYELEQAESVNNTNHRTGGRHKATQCIKTELEAILGEWVEAEGIELDFFTGTVVEINPNNGVMLDDGSLFQRYDVTPSDHDLRLGQEITAIRNENEIRFKQPQTDI